MAPYVPHFPALFPGPRQHVQDGVGQPHVGDGPHGGHEGEVVQSDVSPAVGKRVGEAFVPVVCNVGIIFHI